MKMFHRKFQVLIKIINSTQLIKNILGKSDLNILIFTINKGMKTLNKLRYFTFELKDKKMPIEKKSMFHFHSCSLNRFAYSFIHTFICSECVFQAYKNIIWWRNKRSCSKFIKFYYALHVRNVSVFICFYACINISDYSLIPVVSIVVVADVVRGTLSQTATTINHFAFARLFRRMFFFLFTLFLQRKTDRVWCDYLISIIYIVEQTTHTTHMISHKKLSHLLT